MAIDSNCLVTMRMES